MDLLTECYRDHRVLPKHYSVSRHDRLLRIAARAVPDSGIDLRRKSKGVKGPEAERLRIEAFMQAKVEAMADYVPQEPQEPDAPVVVGNIAISEIQRLVAMRSNMLLSELLSAQRTASIVKPRQIAMMLAKMLTLRSLPEIGRRFGGRDHTTVLHAVRKTQQIQANLRASLDSTAPLSEWVKRAFEEWDAVFGK